MLVTPSDALITILDNILNQINDLNKIEYNKKGRKYKFVNNNFQRIREEDKHLIIYPQCASDNLALISAYSILQSINNGQILDDFPDFCLCIVGVAQLIEANHWYEEENSSVINYTQSNFEYTAELKENALKFHEGFTDEHFNMGANLLICSKLNFLHTDHHIGTKLEGYYMKYYINKYFGADALNSVDILIALKSFVHWANIKGILYKLEVPNLSISDELKEKFDSFPDPVPDLKVNVYERFPSGTSKYSLIRKSIDNLADFKYSTLIPFPSGENYDLNWLYGLCHDIETNPIKYHLRSSVKGLCADAVNLNELNSKRSGQIASLLNLISLVINIFSDTGSEYLLQNSKIPKFSDTVIESNREYYDQLMKINDKIEDYEEKGWNADDITLRLATKSYRSLFDEVMEMRTIYSDDYE